MKRRNPEARGSAFLPKFRRVHWTWKRWLLIAFSIVPFIDQSFIPLARWDNHSAEGMLFLILGFRAAAAAEPPLYVIVAAVGLVSLVAAISHGILPEVSPIWTPVGFALLFFIALTWRKGRKGE